MGWRWLDPAVTDTTFKWSNGYQVKDEDPKKLTEDERRGFCSRTNEGED